jgi:hypothetical protein
MDRPPKPGDHPPETIAKTMFGEFTAFTIFIRSFLGADYDGVFLSLLLAEGAAAAAAFPNDRS